MSSSGGTATTPDVAPMDTSDPVEDVLPPPSFVVRGMSSEENSDNEADSDNQNGAGIFRIGSHGGDIESAGDRLQREHNTRKKVSGLTPLPPSPGVELPIMPSQLLVELHELYDVTEGGDEEASGQWQWRQTGRWVKYEETLEYGADKFGRPHVASLSYHSLSELRDGLTDAVALLDLRASDMFSVAQFVAEALVAEKKLLPENIRRFLGLLILPHRHVHDPSSSRLKRQEAHNSLDLFFYRSSSTVHSGLVNAAYSTEHPDERVPRRMHSTIFGKHLNQQTLRNRKESHLRVFGSQPQNASFRMQGTSSQNDRRPGFRHPSVVGDVVIDALNKDGAQKTGSQTSKVHYDHELMKHLDASCESALCLIGAVDDMFDSPTMVFVRLHPPLPAGSLLEAPAPIRFAFVLIGPLLPDHDYHEIGRSMATLLSNKSYRNIAYNARSLSELVSGVDNFLDDSIVLPPGDIGDNMLDLGRLRNKAHLLRDRRKAIERQKGVAEGEPCVDPTAAGHSEHVLASLADADDDPLRRTGKPFGGLRREFVDRVRQYKSDITDCYDRSCALAVPRLFATIFFPALTFGTILHEDTGQWLGVEETLIATAFGGIFHAIFSAQPLIILGVCGPTLIFEKSLADFVSGFYPGIPLVAVRVWVAVWMCMFCIIAVCFEASWLIRYVTSFADDIMTTLISVIFIYETYTFLAKVFKYNPVLNAEDYQDTWRVSASVSHTTNYTGSQSIYTVKWQPNTALLTMLLVIGTFVMALALRNLRNSRYFGRNFRAVVAELCLAIAVVTAIGFDWFLINDNDLSLKLSVDPQFSPTHPNRTDWLIDPFDVPLHLPFLASIGGFLLFLLIFVETEVCLMLLAKKEHALRKGHGYHWDLLVAGPLSILCAVFGLPWLCAEPVRSQSQTLAFYRVWDCPRSLAHVRALTKYKRRAPGERPSAERVVEQRITAVVTAVSARWLLHRVPVAIPFGVFLYLGVVNLYGVEMVQRAVLLVVPTKYHPDEVYCVRVRPWRMHLYTVVQVSCFAFVAAVKSVPAIAVGFPIAVWVAVGLRHLLLPKLFTAAELHALDGEGESEDLFVN